MVCSHHSLRLHRYFFCCIFILFTGISSNITHAQAATDINKWKALLNRPFDGEHIATAVLWDSISHLPKKAITKIIASLERESSVAGTDVGQLKLALLKIKFCSVYDGSHEHENWRELGGTALRLATVTQDDYLLQSCCTLLGEAYLRNNKSDTAVFFLLKSVALAEGLAYKKETLAAIKISTSNALYRTQNYAQCIAFCRTGINIEKSLSPVNVVTAYNNMGLGYLRLGLPDSAVFFFRKAAGYARGIGWGIWEGIASGNIGDALLASARDSEAMPYWQKDYDTCIKYGELPNAGLTLAYMSGYQFSMGEKKRAINQLQWATVVNKGEPASLVKIYAIRAACYRKMGMHDSADFFLQKHYGLSDSINRAVSQNNFTTVQLKLAYEKGEHEYQLLKNQRQAEITRRNLLIVALLSLFVIVVLLYNRQRLKTRMARQQQAIAKNETASAKEQLSIFTQTLLEKNSQIEKLTASLVQHNVANNNELINQTLLTDYDWNKFKELFEKIHPDFFPGLKKIASTITQAELRLAALIKLNLDNKQMASMQGISLSSLRGNKTRLRQKLGISSETDLESFVKQL